MGREPPSPQEAVWRRMASELFQAGASEDAVQHALRKAGCLAYLRREICEQARRETAFADRGRHRRVGLRAFLFGFAMCALGVAIWVTAALVHMTDPTNTAFLAGGRSVLLGAVGCVVVGFTPMVFGLFKLITGSAVAVVAPPRR
jgi:ferric-dicitrate binding protein FerR (iron transport regulator)